MTPKERALRIRNALRRRMRIRRLTSVIAPADVLTLANAFMGFLAIGVVTGIVSLYERPFFPGLDKVLPAFRDDTFLVAAVLIAIGGVCDALDGFVARKWGSSRLGADLDTIADAITFVATPALMTVAKYGHTMPFRTTLAAGLFLLMGVLRLARFNSNPQESETKTFQGLPTPWAAITVVLLLLVDPSAVYGKYALPFVAILAFLMMSNVAYPKSRDRVRFAAPLMVLIAFLVIGAMIFFPEGQPRIIRGAFMFVTITVALSPFLLARRAHVFYGRDGETPKKV